MEIKEVRNNIVIDIETLGRRNDAAITQIGVAIADEKFNVFDKHRSQYLWIIRM